MRKITIVPYAGLCNRLDSIGSAILYKKENPDIDLNILWFKCNHCNCRFSDLFMPLSPEFPQVIELTSILKDRPGTRRNLYIPKLLRRLWYDIEIGPMHISDRFEEYTEGKQNIYVYKDNRFCKYSLIESIGDVFKPIDTIQHRIDDQINSWGGKCIGLHIRRTDNLDAIKGSPLSNFYNIIEDEIHKDRNVVFYLATDDLMVKQELILKYGNRIKTSELILKRNSVQGMQDAVVDLWCLANTSKIFGSKASTYSLFASRINNIPLVV